jgi:putative endonuclease
MTLYCTYIMTNKYNTVLYIGVTNNLIRRCHEHKKQTIKGFTSKYNVHKLVYYETTTEIESAILREKQLKRWNRNKKEQLINQQNPLWKDLYNDIV